MKYFKLLLVVLLLLSGSLFNIGKVDAATNYVWARYEVDSYSLEKQLKGYILISSMEDYATVYPSYAINESTHTIASSGSPIRVDATNPVGYSVSGGNKVIKYTFIGTGSDGFHSDKYKWYEREVYNYVPKKGALVDISVRSTNASAYPMDGVHTDGYWYKRLGAEDMADTEKYVWKKYPVSATYVQSNWSPTKSYEFGDRNGPGAPSHVYYYKVDNTNKKFVRDSMPKWLWSGNSTGYTISKDGRTVYKWQDNVSRYEVSSMSFVPTYTKDIAAATEVIGTLGDYPDDGIHTDGYWYVFEGKANTPPTATVNNGNGVVGGSQQIVLTGTAQDLDDDTLTISATIGGVTKTTTLTNTVTSKNWTLIWNVAEVPEGIYTNIPVTVSDGR